MRAVSAPFFEIGPKTYLGRRQLLELARAANMASERHRVSVILTSPALDIEHVKRAAPALWVFAQHMDADRPGRSTGAILPEALHEAGADGAMLNHHERPLRHDLLSAAVARAREAGLLSLVCVSTLAEAERIAALHPNLILAEPPQLIATQDGASRPWMAETNSAIAAVDPAILVMHGGGVASPEHVYHLISQGASGTGATSAIVTSDQPGLTADAMIKAVRDGWEARRRTRDREGRSTGTQPRGAVHP